MASLAFQKFRALEKRSNSSGRNSGKQAQNEGTTDPSSSSSSTSSLLQPPSKKAKHKNLLGNLTDRFESSQVRETKRQEVETFLKQEKERQAIEDEEKKRLESERLEKERIEAVRKQMEQEALQRKEERQRQREEEENKYRSMKPAQALFEKSRVARTRSSDSNNNKDKLVKPPNKGAVSDMRNKLFPGKEEPVKPKPRRASEEAATLKLVSSPDVYTKGNCSDIKTMFEEHIAVKKGLAPDPTVPQGPTVKMKRKVNPNLPNVFSQPEQKVNNENKLGPKENIPMDKKTFNRFLGKFEDQNARQAAKQQLQQLTLKQKAYCSKEPPTWSKKQEEMRLQEEERDRMERFFMEEARRAAEEEQRRQEEELERQRHLEKEAKEKKEREEAEEKAKKKASKAKKKAKRKSVEQSELPTLVATTCNDIKKKFLESTRHNQENVPPAQTERPKVRKLVNNPFERQSTMAENASVKAREFPVVRENRLGDIKKRFSQLISQTEDNLKTNEKLKKDRPLSDMSLDTVDSEAMMVANDNADTEEKTQASSIQNEQANQPYFSQSKEEKHSTLRRSKEALNKSLEKLQASRERLNDTFGKRNKHFGKPSKSDMQNYLLSHVLYDGEVKQTENLVKEDDFLKTLEEEVCIPEEDLLDDDRIRDMQKYLALFDQTDDRKSKKKKKKKAKPQPQPESTVKIKIVEVGSLKQQFERKSCQTVLQDHTKTTLVTEQTVGRVKEMFESQQQTTNQPTTIISKRRSRMLSADLLQKFDSLEKAEELKKQKEEEREQRRLQRLAKLEEEKKRQEEARIQAQKLEEERQQQLKLEKMRLEEEARLERQHQEEAARQEAAYQEMLAIEKEKAKQREVQEQMMKGKREKAEPALKRKKVLGRIQHMFEKDTGDEIEQCRKSQKVGSIKGMAQDLFQKEDEMSVKKSSFQDTSLAGVSNVLNSVKNKFEAKEEEPLPISRGVQMKKKNIPAALTFELNEQMMQKDALASPKSKTQDTDWSWKKKDPQQLAVESTIAQYGESKQKTHKSDRERKRAERQRELLDDIHSVNKRLAKKDAIKEHEEKMKEYTEFMAEIQEYLNEPDKSVEESSFKNDIQSYIKIAASKAPKKKKSKEEKKQVNKNTPSGINEIKEKLTYSSVYQTKDSIVPMQLTCGANVETLKTNLLQKPDTTESFQREVNSASKNSVSNIKDIFENETEDTNCSLEKVRVKKKLIHIPAPVEPDVVKKSCYEWTYKKKSIQDMQLFMASHKQYMTPTVCKAVEEVGDNLANTIEDNDADEKEIVEYNQLMEEVEQYLNAPDRSADEIEFKTELEKYMDLVEEPVKDISKQAIVKRRPQRLDITLFNRALDQSPEIIDEQNVSPSYHKSKENKLVRELQSKLMQEFNKPLTKEEILVHNAGTDYIKKGYEKLNRQEEITLMAAPKITAQRSFSDYKNELESCTKTLEELKGEQQSAKWKWKQKTMGDLHNYMKEHSEMVPSLIVLQNKNLLQAEKEIQIQQDGSQTEQEWNVVRQLQIDQCNDMDCFLENVKHYLNAPTITEKESAIKSGIQSYIDLIDEVDSAKGTLEQKPKVGLLGKTGQVSLVRDQLENQDSDENRKSFTDDTKEKWRVGKVNTSLFTHKDDSTNPSRFVDPAVAAVHSNEIKKQLIAHHFSENQNQTLFSAPKTRLVNINVKEKIVPDSRVGPKKWTPVKSIPSQPVVMPKSSETAKAERKMSQPYTSSYAHITDEAERKAAILAKYGIKPRTQVKDSSSSSSSDENEDETMENYIEKDLMKNNDLYVLYGDRLRTPSPERTGRKQQRNKKKTPTDSVDSLRNILSQLRSAKTKDVYSNDPMVSSNESMAKSQNASDIDLSQLKGSCSNMRSMFDTGRAFNTHKQKEFSHLQVEKSSSCTSVGALFQQSINVVQEPIATMRHPGKLQISLDEMENSPSPTSSGSFLPGRFRQNLAKSSSFHKFRQSLESGQIETYSDSEDDEDEVDVAHATDQRSQIESELEELRSCPRIQKMFSINRPKSTYLAKSNSSSAVPESMEEEGSLPPVALRRQQIQNVFEATAAKVTYGGGKTLSEIEADTAAAQKRSPQQPQNEMGDRKWVFDTINKFFDVIEEDAEEEEEEEDSESEYEAEDSPSVFSTQVLATRYSYPQPIVTEPEDEEKGISDDDGENEDPDYDDGQNEQSENDDDEDACQPHAVCRSASSSKIRGLFTTVLQKSASGADFNLNKFKENLGSHLRRRGSASNSGTPMMSRRQIDIDSSSDDDDDEDFQDCLETDRYYRIPL